MLGLGWRFPQTFPQAFPQQSTFQGKSACACSVRFQTKKDTPGGVSHVLVPVTGLEPVRVLPQGILSPWCLPIPPHRQVRIIVNSSTLFERRQDHLGERIATGGGSSHAPYGSLISIVGNAGTNGWKYATQYRKCVIPSEVEESTHFRVLYRNKVRRVLLR